MLVLSTGVQFARSPRLRRVQGAVCVERKHHDLRDLAQDAPLMLGKAFHHRDTNTTFSKSEGDNVFTIPGPGDYSCRTYSMSKIILSSYWTPVLPVSAGILPSLRDTGGKKVEPHIPKFKENFGDGDKQTLSKLVISPAEAVCDIPSFLENPLDESICWSLGPITLLLLFFCGFVFSFSSPYRVPNTFI